MNKAIISILVFALGTSLAAQNIDSLNTQTPYLQALEIALSDGKITGDERALLNILGGVMSIPADSSLVLESQLFRPSEPTLDQSGRWPLVAQNMVLGVGIYGWAIPYVLHADDFRWVLGSEMLSLGAAFYFTHKYTEHKSVTHAQTQMMRYGSLLGLRYGFGLNQLLELDSGDGEKQETLWAWILMGSVPLGHYGGEYLFDRYQPSNGQAWAWTIWTGAAGFATRQSFAALSNKPDPADYGDVWFDYNPDYEKALEKWEKQRTVVELAAYPIGIWAGYRLSHEKDYSFGDALMIAQGWGYGFWNTMMLQGVINENASDENIVMISALGGLGGMFAYDHLVKGYDYSFGQSILMMLGSASGTAAGWGTAVLLDSGDSKPFLISGLIGYGLGTYYTKSILDVSPDGSISSNETQLRISPTPLLARDDKGDFTTIPGLQFSLSFK
jgi:hypothetical protein